MAHQQVFLSSRGPFRSSEVFLITRSRWSTKGIESYHRKGRVQCCRLRDRLFILNRLASVPLRRTCKLLSFALPDPFIYVFDDTTAFESLSFFLLKSSEPGDILGLPLTPHWPEQNIQLIIREMAQFLKGVAIQRSQTYAVNLSSELAVIALVLCA